MPWRSVLLPVSLPHHTRFQAFYSAARFCHYRMAGPAALVVPALKKHTATVIMAHGLGDR